MATAFRGCRNVRPGARRAPKIPIRMLIVRTKFLVGQLQTVPAVWRAIRLASRAKPRGERRRVRSDWMAVECERISVSSAVMSFEHEGLAFNLLDTPATKISVRTPTAR
jgi:hypothetical protein